jgi:hypothetical protein
LRCGGGGGALPSTYDTTGHTNWPCARETSKHQRRRRRRKEEEEVRRGPRMICVGLWRENVEEEGEEEEEEAFAVRSRAVARESAEAVWS